MRASGIVESAAGLGSHEHVGLAYSTPAEFERAALAFLADGLALGQRAMFVRFHTAAPETEQLQALGDLDALIERGQLIVKSLDHVADSWADVVAAGHIGALDRALHRALDAGFHGLRIAADVTGVLREPTLRAGYTRWEHLVDEYTATHPFAALCGMDRSVLGDDLVSDLACLHPLRHAPEHVAPFALFTDDNVLFLTGEVDAFGAPVLDRALASCEADHDPVTLDLSGLDFIDHCGVEVLNRFARRLDDAGLEFVIRGEPLLLPFLRTVVAPDGSE
ncbi:MAG TPA: MEDS domain-containing protein [Acidimicrobiia bacterium]|nr:MEDS domain-containing protein [Acidimicrobiia bacterium]